MSSNEPSRAITPLAAKSRIFCRFGDDPPPRDQQIEENVVPLIYFAAGLEAAIGLLLLLSPSVAAVALFDGDLTAPGQGLGRLAGVALLALAAGSWPSQDKPSGSALRGLFAYNVLATALFLLVGIAGAGVGILLWPAAALHAVLTCLIGRIWFGATRV